MKKIVVVALFAMLSVIAYNVNFLNIKGECVTKKK